MQKTRSAVAKRFRFTAKGRIVAGQAGKRHNMIKRTRKQIRQRRGLTILDSVEAPAIRRMLPWR